ncbi:MAG: hypothetical protein CMB55_01870 [Euryarchaeota archaeon]|jgi:hypothetical protein|nr:hypothetical protein [Euryarchaeota archaeon]|tara:strand:+ start:733 stop:1023 length:291 start_codon:yes stop_codon:yes gene_type:complete
MSRDTNRVQRKVRIPSNKRKKSSSKQDKKPGEIACGISGCDDHADKHLGGRSLSQENAIDTWGEGAFKVRKNRVRVCKACYKAWKKDNKDDGTPHY